MRPHLLALLPVLLLLGCPDESDPCNPRCIDEPTGCPQECYGKDGHGNKGEAAQALCTLPTPVTGTLTTLTYRPGLTVDRYVPTAPDGGWLLVFHGGGGTSTKASKLDANVVAICGGAVALHKVCYAVDYDYTTASTPVGIAFRESLCAARFAAADAVSNGWSSSGGIAGVSWGGTLASATAVYLRAGYTVPGGAGNLLPNGVDLTDAACPTAPAAGDSTIVKAGVLWYPIVDWRSWNVVNNNGAVANANLQTNAGALFGSPAYLANSADMSSLTFPHSTAATGIAWSLAQGTLTGTDGDGFVKLSTQSNAFDAADTTTAPQCNHNFSPLASNTAGGCQALAANCAAFARIGAL